MAARILGQFNWLWRAGTQGCSNLFHESLPGGWSTPDAGGLVQRGGDNPLALGVERRGDDNFGVLQRLAVRLAGARIPAAGSVVIRGGDDALALGVERGCPDRVGGVLQWWNEKLVGRPGFY